MQSRSKQAVLDDEFLPLRAKILEIAAGLDRFDRAAGDRPRDPRRDLLDEAVHLLLDDRTDRAAQVQLLFSRQYSAAWRDELGVE